jgi:hypothetical protein
MRKHKSERTLLNELRAKRFVNEPEHNGQLAARKVLFYGSRYAVAPVHTRFDAVQFFVWDAMHARASEEGGPVVIRQTDTIEEALRGLPA